jgi:hypothetical protein
MSSAPGRYARFLLVCVGVIGALCVIGYVPTRNLAGAAAPAAMVAGCIVSLAAAALAGGLLVAVGADTPQARMQRGFLAMVVRLAAVVVLGAAAVLSGEFPRETLLFWIGTAYVALLPVEVRLAIL